MTAGPDVDPPRIVLASASARRRDLLTAAGIRFDIDPPHIAEIRLPGEPADVYVERMAREKARGAATRHPERVVLAADTIVVVDERVLGKPHDSHEATRMLDALSGRAHVVMTAVAVAAGDVLLAKVASSTVWMRHLSAGEIGAYVATGEPLDKAGAYAIQGGARAFVERVDGALDVVIGLPVALVKALLEQVARK